MPAAEKQKITLGKLPNRALIDHIGESEKKNHQKAQEIVVVTY